MFDDLPLPPWLHPNVLYFIVFLALVHIVFTSIPYVLQALRPDSDQSDFKQRAWSWWPVSWTLMAALALGPTGSWALFLVVGLIALREYLTIQPEPVALWGKALAYALVTGQFVMGYLGMEWGFRVFLPVVGYVLLSLGALLMEGGKGYRLSIGRLHLGVMIAGFALSHLPALVTLLPDGALPAGGVGFLCYIAFLTQFNDLLQYLWGKVLGRHPLAPALSPKKTWEGFLGAGLCTMGLAVVGAPYLSAFSPWEALGLGAAISLFGMLGDLLLSAVKRDVGVKDTGAILPGFGGLLDRVDSMVLVSPAVFYLMEALNGAL